MTIWKWLRINVAVMVLILIVPWLPTAWKYISTTYWNHSDPAVMEFITTPSGDQFVYLNPDNMVAYDELVPAAVMSFGYKLPKPAFQDHYIMTGSWHRKAYVEKPREFLVVKQGIIGRSASGHFVIDTSKRQVFMYQDIESWQAALSKMGIRADVKCHPLPVRSSYVKRGWLAYEPELQDK